ncbi:Probable 2-ketogluconate reductase (2KR) (2-ketoaldonate reductase) [Durusdinium trenchii]|uniref:Probable 2-ketogluconate reductase (2KR) (2-ketoaldonate reductase) n=1 Tax=Durusdinium trenchii TaxID=1381693 RepID=A0ABP0MVQ3_9DINO
MAPLIDAKLRDDAGITLTNGRGAFSSSLAEYCMMCCLHYNKKVTRCQENKRNKVYDRFTMPVLKGKTIGFVGFGDIAKATAKMAKDAFGVKVAVLRRNPEKADGKELIDESFTDKLALFSSSDFVVSTLPGTPATKHFCSTAEFRAMKRGAVFISCGRGVTVDEAALVEVLNDGHIFAALDVFETEPLPESSALWTVPDDRLLITAHNADLTDDYIALGWARFLDNLQAFQRGEPFVTVVDKAAGY